MKDNSIMLLFLFFIVILYILYQIKYVDIHRPRTIYIDRTQQIYLPQYRYNRRPKRPKRPLPPAKPMPPAEKILPIIPVEPMPRPDIKK